MYTENNCLAGLDCLLPPNVTKFWLKIKDSMKALSILYIHILWELNKKRLCTLQFFV